MTKYAESENPYKDIENPQELLFDVQSEWQKHWQNMPEFVQNRQTEYAMITVRFRNQQDLDDFGQLIGQKFHRNSKRTWFPPLPKTAESSKWRYTDES